MSEKQASSEKAPESAQATGKPAEQEGSVARGLKGVVAAETKISRVDGEAARLGYAGYDIRELAEKGTFEEVVYLLWHLELPNKSQLKEFNKKLREQAKLSDGLIYTMRTLPHSFAPMDALRSCVSLLSVYDPEDPTDLSPEASMKRAIRIMAKLPNIVATFERLRSGHEPVEPRDDLGIAANFLYQMTGEEPTEEEQRAMDVGLVLHADHGLNASTFAARVTVATLSDMYSGITSAVGALKGPLHGGANQEVIRMLHEIGHMDRVESYIKDKLAAGEKIMGFGHAVYRNGDPRVPILKEMSRILGERANDMLWYRMSERIEEVVWEEKKLHANVDFYSASVYHTLHIAHDQYTPIFACSRVAGWLAHIMEQYDDNKIIRPGAAWVGHENRDYVPLEKR